MTAKVVVGVVAALVERLDRGYPKLAGRPRAIAAHLPLVVFLPPPLLLVPLVAVSLAVIVNRNRGVVRRLRSQAAQRTGQAVLVAIGTVGSVWVGTGVVDILTT